MKSKPLSQKQNIAEQRHRAFHQIFSTWPPPVHLGRPATG
jgi:hypothetical protein